MNIRKTLFALLAILLVGGLAVWWYFGFTLDFMKFFAAEPTVDLIVTPRQTITPTPPPGCHYEKIVCVQAPCDPILVCPPATAGTTGIVQCSPATRTVPVGALATLTATGGSGVYTWFAPEGNPATSATDVATFSVSYTTPGTKKVTVQSPRGAGSSDIDSVACTVVVTP